MPVGDAFGDFSEFLHVQPPVDTIPTLLGSQNSVN